MLLTTREKLRQLYASKLPEAEMRARKQETFGHLKFEYTQLKAQWNGYAGYDAWFDRALGNAHLVSAATYHGCVPGFHEAAEFSRRRPAAVLRGSPPCRGVAQEQRHADVWGSVRLKSDPQGEALSAFVGPALAGRYPTQSDPSSQNSQTECHQG